MRAALIAAALLTACAPARATEIEDLGFRPGGRAPDRAFDLTISFPSLCCGIDSAAHAAVTERVRTSAAPTSAVAWGWGREGERSLGLTFADTAARDAFACELWALEERLRAARPERNTSLPDPAFQISGAQRKSCR